MKVRQRPLKLFWYWINERHKIYLARQAGKEYPWTSNTVLDKYRFGNVFRQLDGLTQEWIKRYISRLGRGKYFTDSLLIYHCAMYRLFNWPETYDCLFFNGTKKWSADAAVALLTSRYEEDHEKIFDARLIKKTEKSTIEKTCTTVARIWEHREDLARAFREKQSLQAAHSQLTDIPGMSGHTAYEIVCDLRHTRLLSDARDIASWCYISPAVQRGLAWILNVDRSQAIKIPFDVCLDLVREILLIGLAKRLLGSHFHNCEWPFEMCEVMHCLEQFDVFMRIQNGNARNTVHFYPPQPKIILEDD